MIEKIIYFLIGICIPAVIIYMIEHIPDTTI